VTTRSDEMNAADVVQTWNEEDLWRFAAWVSGYAPNVVMRFELYRRRLPARDRAEEAR
jgi:hypothetical protein